MEGYKLPDRENFENDELAEAYALALDKNSLDERARDVLESYEQKSVDQDNMATYSLWREGLELVEVPTVDPSDVYLTTSDEDTSLLAKEHQRLEQRRLGFRNLLSLIKNKDFISIWEHLFGKSASQVLLQDLKSLRPKKFKEKYLRAIRTGIKGLDVPWDLSDDSDELSDEYDDIEWRIWMADSMNPGFLAYWKRLYGQDVWPILLRGAKERGLEWFVMHYEHFLVEEAATRAQAENGIGKETYMQDVVSVYGKYKPVALKVKPVKATLPSEFRVERHIYGDPLADMPALSTNPPEFVPSARYNEERKAIIDAHHPEGFLWPEERKLMHHMMSLQEEAFAWDTSEGGTFKEEFFPPVKFPVIPHTPWVEKNIPIPPGIYDEVCRIIKEKIKAGIYEPSSSSYRSKWFCVLKKDGKSLRLVHSLEPLNKVTIQYSGVPPATAEVASAFSGRSCLALLDIWVGYDERLIDEDSRDLTTFQTPFGPHRLVKLPMGWTNSVPIFHDDVTYILQDEIPEICKPYIDDVVVGGPKTRYETSEEPHYETITENKGIRRFVWEHFQNVNRVC